MTNVDARARVRDRASSFASMVKLSHTIFAAPFAIAAAVLAVRVPHVTPTMGRGVAIAVALVSARTAAMAYNRLVDRDIDAKNPRTAMREIPSGIVSVNGARGLVIFAGLAFVTAASMLGRVPLLLSPFVLAVLLGYSHAKRFTWAAHLWLGVALALAPGGAWIAMGARPELGIVSLMIAVACWVAGFDVLYSLQDESFDRQNKLRSIPTRFGARGALTFSRGLHLVTTMGLALAGVMLRASYAYFAAVVLVGALLAYEQSLVRPIPSPGAGHGAGGAGDGSNRVSLERLDKAFFDVNGWVSLGFLVLVAVDVALWPSGAPFAR